jgi:hypothetical protein
MNFVSFDVEMQNILDQGRRNAKSFAFEECVLTPKRCRLLSVADS